MEELHKQVQALFNQYHSPAHDYKHAVRVSSFAKQIAADEGYDTREAEIAGLLHDMGRTVQHPKDSHAHEGVPIARKLLDSYTDFSDDTKERILKAIELHSDPYTQGQLNNIVQDADKLDGMGALGIMRAYMSMSHLEDFDQENIYPKPGNYGKFETIHDGISLQIEWYNMLYTKKAKELGKHKYTFMIQFMEEFKKEIEETA